MLASAPGTQEGFLTPGMSHKTCHHKDACKCPRDTGGFPHSRHVSQNMPPQGCLQVPQGHRRVSPLQACLTKHATTRMLASAPGTQEGFPTPGMSHKTCHHKDACKCPRDTGGFPHSRHVSQNMPPHKDACKCPRDTGGFPPLQACLTKHATTRMLASAPGTQEGFPTPGMSHKICHHKDAD